MPAPITTSETLVNTATTGDQWDPALTLLADGGWVVVWMARVAIGSETGVFAQRYGADGMPIGGEFQVNSASVDQWEGGPSVAALPDGGWLVTWCATSPHGGPSPASAIVYAQRYDSAGTPAGEVEVNAPDGYISILHPDVAVLADGGWVIVWHSQHVGPDANENIYAQRFDSTGTRVGLEFQVNATAATVQHLPSVTALGDGGWVVTWMANGQDGSGWGIYAQRYNADGSPAGGETLVTTTTAGDQREPHLATLDDGGWIIVWSSGGQDGSGHGIYAQRFDSAGAPVGSEFQVNTTTANDQLYATVEALPGGGWAVSWLSIEPGSDPYGGRIGSIYVQRYDGAGNAVGGETLVGAASEGSFSNLSTRLASLSDGGLVVTWGQYGTDGSGYGVYARTFEAPASVINGTAGNDDLVGTPEPDQINGLGGDDSMFGLQGDDTLDGGDGDDVMNGNGGNDTLTGGAGGDLLNGNPGDDTLDGGDGDDRVVGGPGSDTLYGGSGHDFLRGDTPDGASPSDDYIDGGDGFDRATFYNLTNGVTVSLLMQGAPQNTGQGWDTLLNIEAVSGSVFSDVLIGDGNDNWFTFGGAGVDSHTVTSDSISGNGGNDLIIVGLGDHVVDGGSGTDTLGFGWSRTEVFGGVTVSLALQGAAQDTGQGSMTIDAFENLSGSAYDDVLSGDSDGNLLAGNAGSDVLSGGAGNDILLGDGEVNMSPSNAGPATIFEALDYAGVDFYDADGNLVFLFEGQDLYDLNGNQLPRADLVDEFGDPYSQFTLNGVTYDFYAFVGSPAISDGFAGQDILYGGDGDDTLIGGAGNDSLLAGSGYDSLDGGTGTDTVFYWDAAGPVDLDLGAGVVYEYDTDAVTILTTDTLTGIENAIGSAFDDALVGSAAHNYLDGYTGDDIVLGGGGDDQVNGGAGNDILSGDFGNLVLTGGGNDLVDGGDGNDAVRGRDGNDTVLGGSGNDFVEGGTGDDYIDGGAGFDRAAFFSMATGGVTVDLNLQGIVQNTGQGWDTLVNIEHLSGTAFADTLIGDGGDNWFLAGFGGGSDTVSGNDGNDLVEVGAGNHILTGGDGLDTWSLFGNSTEISSAGVTISLALQGAAQNTEQGMMTASGFENLSGSLHDDNLTGDAGANIMLGDGGSDTMNGGDGSDTLYGDGRMWVDFQGGGGAGPITLFADSSLIQTPGVAGDDILLGGKGDDILYGGRGNDVMTGGAGADRYIIEAQSGADRIKAFAHVDRIVFDASSGVDSFSDLVITAVGKDTLITWGTGDSLLIEGFKPKELTAADFEFGAGSASLTFQMEGPNHSSELMPDYFLG